MPNTAVAIVPIKTNNERLPGKNTRSLGGRPLYEHLFSTLQETTKVSDIYVDSSDGKILEAGRRFGFKTIKRPTELNAPHITGNDLLAFELKMITSPIVCQLFVTTPFLSARTIDLFITTLVENSEIDSVFGVVALYERVWHCSEPINHRHDRLVGTQFMEPIFVESDFYVFRRDAFLRERSRITFRHQMVEVTPEEALDIDHELDFLLAEAIVARTNRRLHSPTVISSSRQQR